ncbi:periplasmic heavy metal sensor [Yoonia sp. BS5-3]|uniref:Periplasmic heavy metal sensor n=1 Tax=Yoonia phaeophyticola TaxID=3137369 RepID=A0ABZ2V8N3_9RHOB
MADLPNKTTGASRLMRIVLVISLALNLAVAGLFVGSMASGRLSDGPAPNFDIGLGPIGRALDNDERREVRRSLLSDGSMRRLNLRGRLEQMITAIEADPYDPDVMTDLLADQLDKTTQLQRNVQNGLLQIIADMTPERRAAFAAELREDMSRNRPPPPQRDHGSGG